MSCFTDSDPSRDQKIQGILQDILEKIQDTLQDFGSQFQYICWALLHLANPQQISWRPQPLLPFLINTTKYVSIRELNKHKHVISTYVTPFK